MLTELGGMDRIKQIHNSHSKWWKNSTILVCLVVCVYLCVGLCLTGKGESLPTPDAPKVPMPSWEHMFPIFHDHSHIWRLFLTQLVSTFFLSIPDLGDFRERFTMAEDCEFWKSQLGHLRSKVIGMHGTLWAPFFLSRKTDTKLNLLPCYN